jgi:hypothetical protein
MQIQTLKDLEHLIKLCRKTGVDSVTIDGITIKLGDMPEKSTKSNNRKSSTKEIDVDQPIPSAFMEHNPAEALKLYNDILVQGALTEEQQLYYSVSGTGTEL